MFSNKKVVVISGYSGVGKSTLIRHILRNFNNVELSVSCTTRLPRLGEQDGKDYYFIDKIKFEKLITNNDFVEYTECFGNYYGTLKSEIHRILDNNSVCILDIDFNGAYNVLVKNICGNNIDCTGILIEAPCHNDLVTRLIARGEQISNINTRTANNDVPKDILKMYKYKIVNNILATSQIDIVNIFKEIISR